MLRAHAPPIELVVEKDQQGPHSHQLFTGVTYSGQFKQIRNSRWIQSTVNQTVMTSSVSDITPFLILSLAPRSFLLTPLFLQTCLSTAEKTLGKGLAR